MLPTDVCERCSSLPKKLVKSGALPDCPRPVRRNFALPFGMKKVAAMVVLRAADRYLLLRRSREPNRDKYVPVGGKLEPHEPPRAAARRECFEETGIDLPETALQFCGILTETSPVDYNWISYIYLAEIAPLPAPACDEGTLEWIAHADLPTVPTPPTDAAIYACLQRGERFVFDATYDDQLRMIRLDREI